jgi:membrane protein DedA with SNARE-associated domain
MITRILEIIGGWIIAEIGHFGYPSIVLLMAIESACIPLPSEIIMPFAGSLVPVRFNLWIVGMAGAFGCLVGSVVAYWVGYWGGRPVLERWGKYILITRHDLDNADRFFKRWGDAAIFLSRLIPVVRTFISLPAGIARMNFLKFSIYTFLGSVPWCLALAFVGQKLGQNWVTIGRYFHKGDIIIGILIVLAIGFFIYRHVRRRKEFK